MHFDLISYTTADIVWDAFTGKYVINAGNDGCFGKRMLVVKNDDDVHGWSNLNSWNSPHMFLKHFY